MAGREVVAVGQAGQAGGDLGLFSNQAREYARASKAPNTLAAYRLAWGTFSSWCESRGLEALPAAPATIADYLVDLAEHGAALNTIKLNRAALGFYHRAADLADPTAAEGVAAVLSGIVRTYARLGKSAPRRKAPVTLDELRAIVEACSAETLGGRRDRALILLGWAGAFRRSEIVALEVDDLEFTGGDLRVIVRISKTDQAGAGLAKIVPGFRDAQLCPVRAIKTWLAAAAVTTGPVFREVDRWGHVRDVPMGSQSVALIVKRAAERAGLAPGKFAGHSLRAGLVTSAAGAGADLWEIAEQTGHKSEAVLRNYIRDDGRGARRAVLLAAGELEREDR